MVNGLMIRYYAVHLQEALLRDSYELHTENMCSNPCPPQAAPSLWTGMAFWTSPAPLILKIFQPKRFLNINEYNYNNFEQAYRNLLQGQFIQINEMVHNLKIISVIILFHHTVTTSMKPKFIKVKYINSVFFSHLPYFSLVFHCTIKCKIISFAASTHSRQLNSLNVFLWQFQLKSNVWNNLIKVALSINILKYYYSSQIYIQNFI